MVKLTGPGTAQKASGTLAGALIFSHTKRGAYLKRHRKPKQPRTPPQIAMRVMMGFLSSQWVNVSANDRATWTDLAQQKDLSEINAYQAYNCDRWRRFLTPSMTYPAPLGGSFAAHTGWLTTAHPGMIRWSTTITLVNQGWGYPIYHIPTAATPRAWQYLVGIVPGHKLGFTSWDHRPLAPGTYHYRLNEFLTTGRFYDGDIYRTRTVTS